MKYFAFAFLVSTSLISSSSAKVLSLESSENMQRLLKEHDTNKDLKITVDDFSKSSEKTFELKLKSGKKLTVTGAYFMANLLGELKLSTEAGNNQIKEEMIFENPVERTTRLIRELFWDGLTRTIDRTQLARVIEDSKIQNDHNYLYVPSEDKRSLEYFKQAAKEMPALKLKVKEVPKSIDKKFLKSLIGKHGLLTLDFGKSYVVPGGRFNEMYGWDSYFEALGLINDGRLKLAKDMVDNFVYEINHYGKILNANRTYYLSRSQPPFLTSMIREVYQQLPKSADSKKWLEDSLKAAIKEYKEVWMGPDRLTTTGLSRYYGTSVEISPEVEPGHYNHILEPYAKKHNLSLETFTKQYRVGKIIEPKLDEYFIHDLAVRESGHDTTYRWYVDGEDRCADFLTVDLNSLLYKAELDIGYIIKHEFSDDFGGTKSAEYFAKARTRKELIRKYLWDGEGLFSDYDLKKKARSGYVSATAFYPLWAYEKSDLSTRILNETEAKKLVGFLLKELEAPGGLTSTSLASLKKAKGVEQERQWDYPNGWAPHQILAWRGLRNYGYEIEANRLTYKWLYMITKNVMDYNGTVPEKYDVVKRTHKVFAEYGNVGTKFAYITREGFGWMNASYQLGLKSLPEDAVKDLKKLKPPREVSVKSLK